MSQEMDWQEDLHRQRMQGVGALALDWLMSSLQTALKGAKEYLNLSHPAHSKGYPGKDWLTRVKNEYQERFGIEFENGPIPFIRLQELVLARNAGVHRTQETLDEYLDKIEKPTSVDDKNRFVVTRDALVSIIRDTEKFVDWIVREMETLLPK